MMGFTWDSSGTSRTQWAPTITSSSCVCYRGLHKCPDLIAANLRLAATATPHQRRSALVEFHAREATNQGPLKIGTATCLASASPPPGTDPRPLRPKRHAPIKQQVHGKAGSACH